MQSIFVKKMVNMGLCWRSLYAEDYSAVFVSAVEKYDLERDRGITSSRKKKREIYNVTSVSPPQQWGSSAMSWREGTDN